MDSVPVHCVYSQSCQHHKDDLPKGVFRGGLSKVNNRQTPSGFMLNHLSSVDSMALAAGNRTFGYTKTETAKRAQYLSRERVQLRCICVSQRLIERPEFG